MNCENCQTSIDSDSYYCDQCGKEIFLCQNCKKVGSGKRCIYDGKLMVSAKFLDENIVESAILPASNSNTLVKDKKIVFENVNEDDGFTVRFESEKTLTLLSLRDNTSLYVTEGDIIGRKVGSNASYFENFKEISRSHASFSYKNETSEWYVTDLNSTYGTKVSTKNEWGSSISLTPNNPSKLSPDSYIKFSDTLVFKVIYE